MMRYAFLVAILSLSACASYGPDKSPADAGFMLAAVEATPMMLSLCADIDHSNAWTYKRQSLDFEMRHEQFKEVVLTLAEKYEGRGRASIMVEATRSVRSQVDAAFELAPDKVFSCRMIMKQCDTKAWRGPCEDLERQYPDRFKNVMRASFKK